MSYNGTLFNRAYQLAMGPKGQDSGTFQYSNTGKTPSALRVAFEIDKNMQGNANTYKITIYNLSPSARDKIGQGWLLRLNAGYVNQIETLFLGNIDKAVSERTGADIVTTLDVKDGGAAISYASINKSYGNNVTLSQILSDVAKAMSLESALSPDGIRPGIAQGLPDAVFARGYVAHGTCRDVLTELLKPHGIEWNIQNGALNLVPLQSSTSSSAQLVSPSTGMIGIPTNNGKTIQFTSLLNPKLLPGTLVSIESKLTSLGGYYKIRDCKISGDTHDKKWEVVAQCTRLTENAVAKNTTSTFEYP